MFLSLLSKEEKNYFLDLLLKLVTVDGATSETEAKLIDKLKYEMGEDGLRYRRSNHSLEKLLEYFSKKPHAIKNIVYVNLASTSLNDELYRVEEHVLLEQIQNAFELSNKKKSELMKLVYAERDLREKAKRVIAE